MEKTTEETAFVELLFGATMEYVKGRLPDESDQTISLITVQAVGRFVKTLTDMITHPENVA